jgi:hypothetical protein
LSSKVAEEAFREIKKKEQSLWLIEPNERTFIPCLGAAVVLKM